MKQMHHLEKLDVGPSWESHLQYNLQENAACQENQKGPSKQHIFYVTP